MQNINNFQYFLATHQTLFVFMIAWSIVWKGFALWKAGKNRDFIWFVVILLINTIGLLEIIYIFAIKNKEIKSETPAPVQTPEAKEEKKEEAEEIVVPAAVEEKVEAESQQEIKQETN